ncbi:CHAT domain-containing protein [Streptomyces sp. NPDC059900]|uniref:CHAT domain-containing protein n=1 Tax=Streptomyces sp. NPDC059900 TaxID=3155816 RepID=UPI00343B3B3E
MDIGEAWARLNDAASSADPLRVRDPELLDGVRELCVQGAPRDVWLVLGWCHWARFAVRPDDSDPADLRAAVDALTPCFVFGLEPLPEPLLPRLVEAAASRAQRLFREVMSSGLDRASLTEAARICRRLVEVLPEKAPDRRSYLDSLCFAQQYVYRWSGAAADLEEAVEAGRAAVAACPTDAPERAEVEVKLLSALRMRFERTGADADLDEALRHVPEVPEAPGAGVLRAQVAGETARLRTYRYARRGDEGDLEAALAAVRRALDALPTGHPHRAAYGPLLSRALSAELSRAELRLGRTPLGMAEAALPEHIPADGRVRPRPLTEAERAALRDAAASEDLSFAAAMAAGHENALAMAVEDLRASVAASPPGHPSHADALVRLGIALGGRGGASGSAEEIAEAVRICRAAVTAAAGHPWLRAYCLSQLGERLRHRAEASGTTGAMGTAGTAGTARPTDTTDTPRGGDLDEAIRTHEEATRVTPVGYDVRVQCLANLCGALITRFDWRQDPEDLVRAVAAARQALAAGFGDGPDHADVLAGLAAALLRTYELSNRADDLDATLAAARQAAAAGDPADPRQAERLLELGNARLEAFRRTGDPDEAAAAVAVLRRAVESVPSGSPRRQRLLSALATALMEQGDTDAAVLSAREAVATASPGQTDWPRLWNVLGRALWQRADESGSQDDMAAARAACEEAVAALPADHPERDLALTGLQTMLQARHRRTADPADLSAAADLAAEVERMLPAGHPRRPAALANAAAIHWDRYGPHTGGGRDLDTGNRHDLDTVVELLRAAADAAPLGHPFHGQCRSGLGSALHARWGSDGSERDLDEAIAAHRSSLATLAPGDTRRPTRLWRLAQALAGAAVSRAATATATATAAQPDPAGEARALLTEVAGDTEAAPSLRVEAARLAAALIGDEHPAEAAGLLADAVHLLPHTAPRALNRWDQQHTLRGFSGLAAEAAARALAAGAEPVQALRLLEQGRAVLLGQLLATRGDLTALRAHSPDLAVRFERLRRSLDDAALHNPLDSGTPGDPLRPTGTEARRRLAAELAAVLGEIRALDGFAAFLLPPDDTELRAHADEGAIVALNVTHLRSDALLLTADGVTHLPLPGLDPATLAKRAADFHQALARTADPEQPTRLAAQEALHEVLGWLWDVAAGPVLEHLGHHGTPPDGATWPRIWWAPGGALSALPLHAAGHHPEAAGGRGERTVMDRVVSSYTPTVQALRHARRPLPAPGTTGVTETRAASTGAGPAPAPTGPGPVPVSTGTSLISVMAETPGATPLPHARLEAERVAARLPRPVMLTEASTADVLDRLPDCAIAHFACHGVSDAADPSRSRLLLRDHQDRPLTVAGLAPVALDGAELAYLSACRTAVGESTDLVDEAIHLTTAFQLAGFRHVVGTLWEIDDRFAAHLADAFYADLVTEAGTADTGRAARALHAAVRTARDRLVRAPSLWAAHLHAGA